MFYLIIIITLYCSDENKLFWFDLKTNTSTSKSQKHFFPINFSFHSLKNKIRLIGLYHASLYLPRCSRGPLRTSEKKHLGGWIKNFTAIYCTCIFYIVAFRVDWAPSPSPRASLLPPLQRLCDNTIISKNNCWHCIDFTVFYIQMTWLTKLNCGGNVTETGVISIVQGCPDLTVLHMRYCKFVTDFAGTIVRPLRFQ